MKIIISILSVYILVLTATPCIDTAHDTIVHATGESQAANNNHVPGDDHCSPFCTCQCCATPVVFINYTVQLTCFSFSQKLFPEYPSSYLSTLFTAIWQPPKIS